MNDLNARCDIGVFEACNDFLSEFGISAHEQSVKGSIFVSNERYQPIYGICYLLVFVILESIKDAVLRLPAFIHVLKHIVVFRVLLCHRPHYLREYLYTLSIHNSEDT